MTDIQWQNRIIAFGTKPADQFQANERNWRKHPTAQQEVMRQSLRRVGWVGVVLENVQTGNVVDGHERIWEALDNGNADVPFIQVDLTPDEEAFVLATFDTIGHMAQTDGPQLTALLKDIAANDASLLELTQTVAAEMGVDIAPAVPDAPDAPIDRAAELQVKWATARGQVWQVGRHRVMCGDSTSAEDMAVLMDGAVSDAVITDVPYEISQDSNGLRRLDYGEWDKDGATDIAISAIRLCKDIKTITAFCGDEQLSALLGLWPDRTRRTVAWVKPNPTVLNGEHVFLPALELAAHGRSAGAWFGGKCVRSVWEGTSPKDRNHPNQKPEIGRAHV